MFGYVTICEPELKMKDWRKYRSYYCGLCRTLKERHGNVGQLTLTYDMTFAVILLTSLYEVKGLTSSHRCKTHPVKKQWMIQNEITEYCADMNVLLAYYHMIDNWQDEKKVSGLLASKTLHGKAKKIEKKYKRQSQVIRRELKKLAEYEKENCQNIDLPAGCFGRLMEELLVYKEDMWEPTLRKVGFFLGKFIYILDAYDDVEKDVKNGNYNPFAEKYIMKGFDEQVRQLLIMMMAQTCREFEKLPIIEYTDILRNILYSGVWCRFETIARKRREAGEKKHD